MQLSKRIRGLRVRRGMTRITEQGDRRPMSDNREAMKDLKGILTGREAMYV